MEVSLASSPAQLLAATLSSGTRTALFSLAALLLVGLGVLIAFALVLRRKPKESPPPERVSPGPALPGVSTGPRRAGGSGLARSTTSSGGAVAELVPAAEVEVEGRLGKDGEPRPTGVIARICPRCRERYDLANRFCKTDGAELHTIN